MNENKGGCFVAFCVIGAGVLVGVGLAVDRGLSALAERYGDAPFEFIGALLVLAAALLILAVPALVFIILRRQWFRTRHIYPDVSTALFPVVDKGKAGLVNPNHERAQIMAAMLANANGNLRAATVRSALEANPRQWAELPAPETPTLPAPALTFPQRVEVYSSPIPPTLAIPVGVDGNGRPVALPLRGLGNVVVGGLPNYGKSELLGSMAAGLLRQDPHGERSQLAVIDMKLVSFGNLPNLAGLRWPVATDLAEAHEVVAAVRAECARRYVALREAGARTLEEYEQRTGERLPYVTVLIDEIADLTCDDDRGRRERFLASAMELARKGRAAGVGLVMATQRPSVDVLPSSLRNLAGAAVAFKVQRNHDSVAVLGEPGAEALPSVPGRCLVKRGEIVECQAYACGLEGGRFDAFLASLPRAEQGVVAEGWPVRQPAQPLQPGLQDRPTTGFQGASQPPVVPVAPVVERLQPGRQPNAEHAATMRRLYAEGWSLTRLCQEFWGYKDGVVFDFVKQAVENRL